MGINCLIPSVKSRELGAKLGLNDALATTYIGAWQTKYHKGLDTYPTYDELLDFIIDEHFGDMTTTQKAERRSILKNAKSKIVNGRLGINGKESNLSLPQYIEVRTKAFKRWFGDWESDPENASKVVDENGEPLVVYHVARWAKTEDEANFDTFDTSRDVLERGFYFGPIDENGNVSAASSSVNVGAPRAFFLNARNPLSGGSELFNVIQDSKKGVIADGHDGVLMNAEEYSEYKVFNPNQIKSATENNGEYAIEDNNIFHNRTLKSLSDILYSKYYVEYDGRKEYIRKEHGRYYITKHSGVREWLNSYIKDNTLSELIQVREVPNTNEYELVEQVPKRLDKILPHTKFGSISERAEALAIIDFLQKKFDISYTEVSRKQAARLLGYDKLPSDINSFIIDNKAYFIRGKKFNADIAAEEMLHPLVYGIKYSAFSNPTIFEDLLKEAKQKYPNLAKSIQVTYSKDRDLELVTQALAREFVEVRRNHSSKESSNLISKFIDWFKEFLGMQELESKELPNFEATTLTNLAHALNSDAITKESVGVLGKSGNYLPLLQKVTSDPQLNQLFEVEGPSILISDQSKFSIFNILDTVSEEFKERLIDSVSWFDSYFDSEEDLYYIYDSVVDALGNGDTLFTLDKSTKITEELIKEVGEALEIQDKALITRYIEAIKKFSEFDDNFEEIPLDLREEIAYQAVIKRFYEEYAKEYPDVIEQLKEDYKDTFIEADDNITARVMSEITGIPEYDPAKVAKARKTVTKNVQEASKERTPDSSTERLSLKQKLDRAFNPIQRAQATQKVARKFSEKAEQLYQKELQEMDDKIAMSSDPDRKNYLRRLKSRMSKKRTIEYNMDILMEAIRQDFLEYVGTDSAVLEQEYINDIISQEEAEIAAGGMTRDEMYTDEELAEGAQIQVSNKKAYYSKMADNIRMLLYEAGDILLRTEGVTFDYDQRLYTPTYKEAQYGTEYGDSESSKGENMSDKEESPKDSWMLRAHSVAQYESLSKEVRKMLAELQVTDGDGNAIPDSVGDPIFLNPGVAHATLLRGLQGMIHSRDLMPCLEKLAVTQPWIYQLISKMEDDPTLQTAFYTDLRKEFVHMTALVVENKGKSNEKTNVKNLNEAHAGEGILEEALRNISNQIFLSERPIYNSEEGVDKENADYWTEQLEGFVNEYIRRKAVNRESALQYANSDEVLSILYEVLRAAGVDVTPDALVVAASMTDPKLDVDQQNIPSLLLAAKQLLGLMSGDAPTVKNTVKEGKLEMTNPASACKSQYRRIGKVIGMFQAAMTEDGFNERHKGYFSYGNPSFFGTLITKLRGDGLTDEEYKSWLEAEFLTDCEWFKDANGRVMLPLIKELLEHPERRSEIRFKRSLHWDGKELEDMVGADYTANCMYEFMREGNSYAYYALPVTSNSGAHELMRLKKDVSAGYKTRIVKDAVNIVRQEITRIHLVKARNAQPGIVKIDNYDMTEDSVGGAEFKFIPKLNTYISKATGKTILQIVEEMEADNKSVTEIDATIEEFLTEVIDVMFEESVKDMYDKHLFEWDNEGKAKYAGLGAKESKALKEALQSAEIQLKEAKRWSKDMKQLKYNVDNDRYVNYREAVDILETIKKELNGIGTYDSAITNGLRLNNLGRDAYEKFWYNNFAAKNTIIQLSTGDLAFYKNTVDFYKRFKEVHAPGTKLHTEAMWNGERIGSDTERSITLTESKKDASYTIDNLDKILDKEVAAGRLTDMDKQSIINAYKGIDEADGQSYRTLKSYRKLCIMANKWSEDLENAYNNIRKGKFAMEDFMVFYNSIKPYAYSSKVKVDSGIAGHTPIRTVVQHKNSETVLPSLFMAMTASIQPSSKLAAMQEWMDENDIDIIHMHSVVKVGGHGTINLNGINDPEGVKKALDGAKNADGTWNTDYMTEISYEDYSIQGNVSEHIIDADQLLGSQMKKIVIADLADDWEADVNGVHYTKQTLIDHYNNLLTADIIESFTEVDKIFSDPKILERELQKQIANNSRYDKSLAEACTWDAKNHRFNLPLGDPIQKERVQELMNSILKNRVSKTKVKGGSLVQVSAMGYDKLHVKYGKKGNVESVPVYMPAAYEDMLKCYMKKVITPSGQVTYKVDIETVPDELKRLIGYRIPTENKYSILPLEIVGFLPQYYGSTIVVPPEVVTMTGSDFDIDKMYIFMPEANTEYTYDWKTAIREFESEYPEYAGIEADQAKKWVKMPKEERTKSKIENQFRQWWKTNKDFYVTGGTMSKIKYDHSKSYEENTRQQRNNELFDVMNAALTHPDNAPKIMTPGGFAGLKKTSRIIELFSTYSKANLCKFCGLAPSVSTDTLLKALNEKSEKELRVKLEESKNAQSPLDQSTQDNMTQQNMAGNNLVSIYAVANASHSMIQLTDLAVNKEIELNGIRRSSLHDMFNHEGKFVSNEVCQFLAASVDNAKDPILKALNQTMWSTGVTMLLLRLGFTNIEVSALMAQPIIKKAAERIAQAGSSADVEEILTNLKNHYNQLQDSYNENHNTKTSTRRADNMEGRGFLLSDLLDSMNCGRELEGNVISDYAENGSSTYYRDQAAIANKLIALNKIADELRNVLAGTRADSNGGMPGPGVAENIIKNQNAEINLEGLQYLRGVNWYINPSDLDYSNAKAYIESVKEKLKGKPLMIQNAYHLFGVGASEVLFYRWFHYYDDKVLNALKYLREISVRGKLNAPTVKTFLNDLDTFLLGELEVFGDDNPNTFPKYNEEDAAKYKFLTPMTAREKRRYYSSKFVDDVLSIINTPEFEAEISENTFMKSLRSYTDEKQGGFKYIGIEGNGTLTGPRREQVATDWESLMYSEHPLLQQLAIELLKYQYYRKGLGFGNKTFSHLAPLAVKLALPGYRDKLQSLIEEGDLNIEWYRFVKQFIRNHLNNKSLVFNITKSLPYSGVDLTGDIPDMFIPSTKDTVLIQKTDLDGTVYFREWIALHFGEDTAYYSLNMIGDEVAYVREYPMGVYNNATEFYPFENDPESEYKNNTPTEDDPDGDGGSGEQPGLGNATVTVHSNLQDAYKNATGEEFPSVATYTLTENTEYKDANNEKPCQ